MIGPKRNETKQNKVITGWKTTLITRISYKNNWIRREMPQRNEAKIKNTLKWERERKKTIRTNKRRKKNERIKKNCRCEHCKASVCVIMHLLWSVSLCASWWLCATCLLLDSVAPVGHIDIHNNMVFGCLAWTAQRHTEQE